LADHSRVWTTNRSAADPNLISPGPENSPPCQTKTPKLHSGEIPEPGDKVAPVSAARHNGIPAAGAVVTSRAFGYGCAGLSVNSTKWIDLHTQPKNSLVHSRRSA